MEIGAHFTHSGHELAGTHLGEDLSQLLKGGEQLACGPLSLITDPSMLLLAMPTKW